MEEQHDSETYDHQSYERVGIRGRILWRNSWYNGVSPDWSVCWIMFIPSTIEYHIWVWVKIRYPNNWMVHTKLEHLWSPRSSILTHIHVRTCVHHNPTDTSNIARSRVIGFIHRPTANISHGWASEILVQDFAGPSTVSWFRIPTLSDLGKGCAHILRFCCSIWNVKILRHMIIFNIGMQCVPLYRQHNGDGRTIQPTIWSCSCMGNGLHLVIN